VLWQQQQQQQHVCEEAPPVLQPSSTTGVRTRHRNRAVHPGELLAQADKELATAKPAARVKRVRKITTAQREAHKRFRERRKNQVRCSVSAGHATSKQRSGQYIGRSCATKTKKFMVAEKTGPMGI
jgi:hypothetical protein